jgi:hypothetical protein
MSRAAFVSYVRTAGALASACALVLLAGCLGQKSTSAPPQTLTNTSAPSPVSGGGANPTSAPPTPDQSSATDPMSGLPGPHEGDHTTKPVQ